VGITGDSREVPGRRGLRQETVLSSLSSSSCKPEMVLESANVISYWDRFIVTDKAVDFNRPDIVLIHRENKTATLQ
jgi:hypothetical protein